LAHGHHCRFHTQFRYLAVPEKAGLAR
jgi:hypothetical protein